MCHIPEDNPDNAHTISVSVNAVPDHLAHGDKLGPCGTPQSCDDSFKSGPDPESFMQRITSKDSYLNVYPNPTSGEVYVEFSLDEGVHTKITLIDIQGASHEVLYDNTAQHSEESQIMIDSQLLSTGIYIVRMQTSAGQLKTTKLIVN